ncbi:MAG: FkbM family methyltransferase [Pseudomonadota bacterium]
MRNRNLRIISGVGAGLKFNIGMSNPDYALGINELPVQHAFKKFIKSGDIVYDIGANIGFFTMIAAMLVEKTGYIYAFEPVTGNVENILKNIKLNNFLNITVIDRAVSSSTGKEDFYLTKNYGGHTLSSVACPPDVIAKIIIETVSIDELIAEKKIMPPDIIKIDVEGAEIDVLKGMVNTLKQYRPTVIYEIDDRTLSKLQNKQEDIKDFLYSFGYEIRDLEASYKGLSWFVRHAVAIYTNN